MKTLTPVSEADARAVVNIAGHMQGIVKDENMQALARQNDLTHSISLTYSKGAWSPSLQALDDQLYQLAHARTTKH